MCKRVLSVILASALLFALSTIPSLAASAEALSESETAEISAREITDSSSDITPPGANKNINDENMILWIVMAMAAVLVIIVIAVVVTKKKN